MQSVLIIRGFAQDASTARLARELGCDRMEMLHFRRKLQASAFANRDVDPLPDGAAEADEITRTRGKRGAAPRSGGPPRRRANERRGHETYANDRPRVCGVIGRQTRKVKPEVVANSGGATLERVVRRATEPGTRLYTDEWSGYDGLPAMNRPRSTVRHGERDAPCNNMDGLWAGLRSLLHPFRGVHKRHRHQYVALFEWSYDLKRVTATIIQALLVVRDAGRVFTDCPS